MSVDRSPALTILLGVPMLADHGSLSGLAGGVIATGFALIAAMSGVKDLNQWRRLATTDPVSINESVVTKGLVQIQGDVRPVQQGNTVISPIQEQECVAYDYKVTHQVHGTGDPSIDSGTECNPFIIFDGTAEICVAPTEESLSLTHTTTTARGSKQMLEQVDEEKLDLEPSAYTEESGLFNDYIELMEGTVSIGEKITIVGKANEAPERAAVNAVMTAEEGPLIVADNEPGTTGLKTGARGLFLLVIGVALGSFGLLTLMTNIAGVS